MATQLTIRARVIEDVDAEGTGFPKEIRISGAGSFDKDFVDALAQEAVDSYFGQVFMGHGYAVNVYKTGFEVSDDMAVPVEFIGVAD